MTNKTLKIFTCVAILFFSSSLFSQQFIDVFPDKTHLNEAGDSRIYLSNPDYSLDRITIPVPAGLGFYGRPRPKVRFEHFWISSGKKLYSRAMNASEEKTWDEVPIPENIEHFFDFEIISDKEAIISGCIWRDIEAEKNLYSNYLHFVYNYQTGEIIKPIKTFDVGDTGMFDLIKHAESYILNFGMNILIVGKYSGMVTVIDSKEGKQRDFVIVPDDELPADPKEAVNSGSAIAWASPLANDRLLFCFRLWIIPNDNSSKPTGVYCFRTLDLKTGEINFEGSHYRGHEAVPYLTLYEKKDGQLELVRQAIKDGIM